MTIAEQTAVPTTSIREAGLISYFARHHPKEFAQSLVPLSLPDKQSILESLDEESMVAALARLPQPLAFELIDLNSDERIVRWLELASMDDATRLMLRVPEQRRSELLRRLQTNQKRRVLGRQMRLDKNSVGAIADKDLFWFPQTMSCGKVREYLKLNSEIATSSAIVVDESERVLGLLDYLSLIQSNDEAPVGNCVINTVLIPDSSLPPSVVNLRDWHRVDRIPVVDQNSKATGVLHWNRVSTEVSQTAEPSEPETYNILIEVLDSMVELVRDLVRIQRQKAR